MKRREREAILRQGVVLPETPRERTQKRGLAQDVADSPLRGRPLRRRYRNFTVAADAYLASLGGPLPYMLRLREIERLTREHEERLAERYAELRGDPAAWRDLAETWSFEEVNDLIERHNRWYPAEARLPMDPKTGDFALVNGEPYRREPLDAAWILRRFPAGL